MRTNKVFWIDLFCGAGGTTTGIHLADSKAKVIACVNHDPKAIESHRANFPEVIHFTEDIRDFKVVLKLKELVKKIRLQYPGCFINLWASLECTNFSNAKGGLPRNADSRTLAEHLYMYIDELDVDYIYIENVKEFRAWGPLDENGKPISRQKGIDYLKWVDNIKKRGYNYRDTDLNSADFYAYTSRNRYFGIFAKENLFIEFPTPEIQKKSERKPVKEVLDLTNKGANIFEKVRSDKTIARILSGVKKAIGKEHFLTSYYGNGQSHSIDSPCNTLTTKDRYALHYIHYEYSAGGISTIDQPAGTITTTPKHNLVTVEWLADSAFGRHYKSVEEPCMTIIARQDKKPIYLLQAELGYCEDFIKPTDSEIVKELKEFMIKNSIKAIYIRMLTIDEMLMIQGFPKNYILKGTKADQTKFIGNSVSPVISKKLIEANDRAINKFLKAA